MLLKLLIKIFGSYNNRIINRLKLIVDNINNVEKIIKKLNNKNLSYKTTEFRNKIKFGFDIKNILVEAFAVVREVSNRINGIRHFDTQLLGGIILNGCCIIEMCTGEGKTLTSTLPIYLNALLGKGIHVVTINNYLAKRDANINRFLFEFLGLTVGVNLPNLPLWAKRAVYKADITYGTSSEFGFDYLRDNMVFNLKNCVQRDLYFALIDEVDSILIDEARTPLVISGFSEKISDVYINVNKLVLYLIKQNKYIINNCYKYFIIDEKERHINLTEKGLIFIEKLLIKFNIVKKKKFFYSSFNIKLIHHFIIALRAHILLVCNVDYIVKDNKIIIIDEYTGRIMPDRRWSNGLHQAVEAKENLNIQIENQALASITIQNYFLLYKKLSGMTGTAYTEIHEFKLIYKLNTIVLPTNLPMIRKDYNDLIYITEREKINAVILNIKSCIKKKQPVLIGTVSIEKSELISKKLNELGISHKILNAKFHSIEADIISQAGELGSVTISTNMAGRGTDIILGGNLKKDIELSKLLNTYDISIIKKLWKKNHDAVIAVGGLHVIGTERHESRRIDNQLCGRSGRQGDVGSSRFYLSFEDNLLRIFISKFFFNIINNLVINKNEAIKHPFINKAVINAQQKIENINFNIRKQLLDYDNIINIQRTIIYTKRNKLLKLNDISVLICNMQKDVIKSIINIYIPSKFIKTFWDINGLENLLKTNFNLNLNINKLLNVKFIYKNIIFLYISKHMELNYKLKKKKFGVTNFCNFEKNITLSLLDSLWKKHLNLIDYLRQGIYLRCYAQKDPKQEYKHESYLIFIHMLNLFKYKVVNKLSKII